MLSYYLEVDSGGFCVYNIINIYKSFRAQRQNGDSNGRNKRTQRQTGYFY